MARTTALSSSRTTTSMWTLLCSPSEHQDCLTYFPTAIYTLST
jgi:hypothetical protein